MKNKITFFFSFMLVCWLITTPAKGQGRFSLAPTLIQDWHKKDFTLKEDGTKKANSSYQGVTAGLTLYYALSNKWALSSGFLFNRSSGYYRWGPRQDQTNDETYQSFQLPILINYTTSVGRLSPYFSAGLLVNYTYHVRRVNPNFTYEANQNIDGPEALVPYAQIGLGAKYRITPKLAFVVQPTGAYQLGWPSRALSQYHDYLLGLQTQVKFSF